MRQSALWTLHPGQDHHLCCLLHVTASAGLASRLTCTAVSETDTAESGLTGWDSICVDVKDAVLICVDVKDAVLICVDVKDAVLICVDVKDAVLICVDVKDAVLICVDVKDAVLIYVDVKDAVLICVDVNDPVLRREPGVNVCRTRRHSFPIDRL